MRVFISYRRADLGGNINILVGRLADHLGMHFGDANVFLDTITISPGQEFDEVISEHIAQAQAILAVVGPDWLQELQNRKNDKEDFVRLEIKAALDRSIPVIPVLIDNTEMPSADDLPEGLAKLERKNAFILDSGRNFRTRVAKLIVELESLIIPTFIEQGPFRAVRESYNQGNLLKFSIEKEGAELSYGEVLDLWIADHDFRDFYCALIKNSGLVSYVWETPAITKHHLDRKFEFVLLSIPGWSRTPDHITYAQFFDIKGGDNGVVVFANLGKDALLVVPSPQSGADDYSNLAAFLNNAPETVHHALWRTVGQYAKQTLTKQAMWISVAGGGITWLHVRLDSAPKYYRHGEYRPIPLD